MERKGYVVPQHLEPRAVEQVLDIAPGSGEEIVDAEYVVAEFEQTFTQMRTDKARAARYQYASRLRRCLREGRHRSGWCNGRNQASWNIHVGHSETIAVFLGLLGLILRPARQAPRAMLR